MGGRGGGVNYLREVGEGNFLRKAIISKMFLLKGDDKLRDSYHSRIYGTQFTMKLYSGYVK